jgi:23S rRNA (pseudouridine1915-N3)-methyltransferase
VKLTVVAVGRLRVPALRALADDYLKRIRRFVHCEEVELRAAEAVAKVVPAGTRRVGLDVGGESLSSGEFASRLERWSVVGKGEIAFVVGGPEGLAPEVLSTFEHRLSLSRMTLPHRLARILLYEQIYRAFTILRGEPYAREE